MRARRGLEWAEQVLAALDGMPPIVRTPAGRTPAGLPGRNGDLLVATVPPYVLTGDLPGWAERTAIRRRRRT
ncbi:MAG: hypothetical protein OXQ90_11070 [Gammaproteobacteria bacterium]|nr:hypothetical protein [Gammaproteobacteria bacterium]